MAANNTLLTSVAQLSLRFATLSDPEAIQTDLYGFVLAIQTLHNEVTARHTAEATMLHRLLTSRHDQDLAEINLLRAQLAHERSKGDVRDEQIRMWHKHVDYLQAKNVQLEKLLQDVCTPPSTPSSASLIQQLQTLASQSEDDLLNEMLQEASSSGVQSEQLDTVIGHTDSEALPISR